MSLAEAAAMPEPDASGFETCTVQRLAGASALRRAAILLARERRTAAEDADLLAAAGIAVESAAMSASSGDDLVRLVPELVRVQALSATGNLAEADRLGCRLWPRAGRHAQLRTDLALVLAECARRRGDAVAVEHWLHLAALAIGAAGPSPARARASARLAALGRAAQAAP